MRPVPWGWMIIGALVALVFALMLFGPVFSVKAHAATVCVASYYGGGSGERLARHTASGEVFDWRRLTAAHRTLPFGTRVRVNHGSRSVTVRINDRGPARSTGRCIDLTRSAARALGMIRAGTARVRIDVLN